MTKQMLDITQYFSWIELEIGRQKFGKEPKSLFAPLSYMMSLGGKRMRPLLILLAYSMFKKDAKKIIGYAVAIEIFHNFTLIHDDIMDQAVLRRGQLSVHKKWNLHTALLAGDVMLVKVFEALASIDKTKTQMVYRLLAHCATTICEGQQMDMEFESQKGVTEKEYITMIEKKTATLLGFSLQFGAMMADAPEEKCLQLRKVGIDLGLGFQLKDDLLDVYAQDKKFGKQMGNDIVTNKKTMLLIKAMQIIQGKDRSDLEKWMLAKGVDRRKKIVAIRTLYDRYQISYLTEARMQQYFDKALRRLKKLSSELEVAPLMEYVKNLIDRKN